MRNRLLFVFMIVGFMAGCTAELDPNNNSSGFDPSQAEFCDYDPDDQTCTTESGEPGYCSSESKCLPCDWLAAEGISTSVCNGGETGQDAGTSDISEDTSQDTSAEDTQDDTESQDTGSDTQISDTGSGDTGTQDTGMDTSDTGSQDTGSDTQDTSDDTDGPDELSFCGDVNAPCVTSLSGLGWCNSQNECVPCERVPGVDFCPGCATDGDCASNEMCDTATNTCVFDPNAGQDTGVDAGADTGNPDTGSTDTGSQDTGVDTGTDTGDPDTGNTDTGGTTNDTGSQDTGGQPTYETCTNVDGICQAQGGAVGWCAPTQQCIPCSSLTSYNVPACGCSADSDCAPNEVCADISGSAVDICVPENTGGSDAGMDAGDTADTTDTTSADTGTDTSDVADSGDASDANDADDVSDASDTTDGGNADASDASDTTSDASDAGDTADTSDAMDSGDTSDATDTTADSGDTGSDASDADAGSNGVDFDHSGGNTPNLEVYASFANSTYTHVGFMWEYLPTEPLTQDWENTTDGWEVEPIPTQDSQSTVDIVTFSDYRQDVDYFRFNMKLCDQVDSNGNCTPQPDWLCERTATSPNFVLTSGDDPGEVLEVLYEGQACNISYVESPVTGGCSAVADCTGISP